MTADTDYLASSFQRAERHREGTAFHEAAHAGVAWALRLPVGRVSVRPDLACWGQAWVGNRLSARSRLEVLQEALAGAPVSLRQRRAFEGDAMVLLAGRLGEQHAVRAGEAQAPLMPPQDSVEFRKLEWDLMFEDMALAKARPEAGVCMPSDDEQTRELVYALSGGRAAEARPYDAWLEARAQTLIDSEFVWKIVRAVAAALLEHESLSGAAARRVILSALEPQAAAPLEASNYVSE
jgi:hypothetical protein